MRIWLNSLIFVLCLTLSLPAFAQGKMDSGGAQSSTLTIESYDPTKVKFHSYGHLSRWYESPLANQDAHLWTGIVVFFLVTVGATGLKLYRSRKAASNQYSQQETMINSLLAKEKRLQDKLALVNEKVQQGEISKAEARAAQDKYIAELEKVNKRIRRLNELEVK